MSATQHGPNIVFLFSDQQRWDTLGCYGQPLDITPNLDRLAREGVLFENVFTCQPVCGPARSCLMTGKYATETGCFQNGISLPRTERTLANHLSGAGYEVGYIGKWHLASDDEAMDGREAFDVRTKPIPPERRGGFNDFWLASDVLEFTSHSYDGHMFDGDGNQRDFPPGRYRVDAQTDWVLEYLQTRAGERPFFLFVSYLEPHFQNDHVHFEGPTGSKERFKDSPVPGDLVGTEGDWREEYPDYLGCCWSLDQNVGRIREELTRLGLADNTLLIYSSDHGCHFRTRNREYKRSCHDASLRIPLVMHGPGFTGGRTVEGLVSLMDLPPTVLRAGGVAPPEYMRGRALQELTAGDATDWPQEAFAQISESHCGRTVRTKEWKYSVRAPKEIAHPRLRESEVYVEDCLYDLEADPHERHNLAGEADLAGVRADLAKTLVRRMVGVGEKPPEIRPAG